MKQKITRLLLMSAILCSTFTMNAQVKSLEKYADTKDVAYVYVSKAMLNMIGNLATPEVPGFNMSETIQKLTAVQVITSENKKVSAKIKTDIAGIISKEKYELLMQVDDEESKVRIYYQEGKSSSSIVMVIDEDGSLTVVAFTGKFTNDDVKKMVKKTK